MRGLGYTYPLISEEEVAETTRAALAEQRLDGKRILIIIPDSTRSAPIPQMFRLLHKELAGRAAALDFLVALGTHPRMSREQIDKLVGVNPKEWETTFTGVKVFNHEWWKSETFVGLGTISAEEVEEISGGRLRQEVDVRINRLVTDYDQVIICGPVFPHEVVGFSGGNKYFFPGVGGPEVIDLSHWLGALITNYEMIGTRGITPVRRLFDRAAAMIPTPKLCFAMVVAPGSSRLAGLYVDTPETAWSKAAELSARVHVNYVEKPFRRVFSVMPERYDDMWTAAKGMYKLEPAVTDGGEVIIYAPHITEFSYTHGEQLAQIGYHVRDYFTKQWDKFRHHPSTVLAHSTHLKGAGSYDARTGEERPRVNVTLATGISKEKCQAHNVGYLDPNEVKLEDWTDREDEGIVVVPNAGEVLYRVGPRPSEQSAEGKER